MMARNSAPESCVFKAFGVTVEGSGFKCQDSTVHLYRTKIEVLQNDELKKTILMTSVKSIQVHQPIFGANYISVECLENQGKYCLWNLQVNWCLQVEKSSMQMTFTRGGAVEFSRAFFRLNEGELVSTETAPIHQPVDTGGVESKKNV